MNIRTRCWRAGAAFVLLVTASLTLSGCTFNSKALMDKIGSLVQTVSDIFANPRTNSGGTVSSSTPLIEQVPGLTGESTRPPASVIGGGAGQDDTTTLVIHDPDAPPGMGGSVGKSSGLPIPAGAGTVSGPASQKSASGKNAGEGSSGSLAQVAAPGSGMNTAAGSGDGVGAGPDATGAAATNETGSGSGDEERRVAELRAELEETYLIRLSDGEDMTVQASGVSYKTIGRKTTFTLAHLEALKTVLSGLPRPWVDALAFVKIKAFTSLERVPSSGGLLLGAYNRHMNEVWVSDHAFSYSYGYTSTLVHELTHVLAAKKTDLQKKWTQKFWGGVKQPPPSPNPPAPTEYGASCTEEDLADSVMLFVHEPSKLDPERLAFIQTEIYGK